MQPEGTTHLSCPCRRLQQRVLTVLQCFYHALYVRALARVRREGERDLYPSGLEFARLASVRGGYHDGFTQRTVWCCSWSTSAHGGVLLAAPSRLHERTTFTSSISPGSCPAVVFTTRKKGTARHPNRAVCKTTRQRFLLREHSRTASCEIGRRTCLQGGGCIR